MKAFVAVTDNDWFAFLASQPGLDEVNFWTPSGKALARMSLGEPVLFKLHAPDHYIAGGGFFAHFSVLPISLAWETFGVENGAASYDKMRERVENYRGIPPNLQADYKVGCVILEEPFFLARDRWITPPSDFDRHTQRVKTYDLASEQGRLLWQLVLGERALKMQSVADDAESTPYGEPRMFRPRLGQGGFRILVTDTYERRCAVTGERALPVLQAAHIRPVSRGGLHRVDNGLLLRSDVHTLFDRGYLTVTPQRKILVSKRLHSDFHNGEQYYQYDKREPWRPQREDDQPSREFLEWHADTVFLR